MENKLTEPCTETGNGVPMADRKPDGKRRQALCIASVASNLDNFNRSNVDILLELGYEVTLAANFHSKEDINSQEKIDSFAKEMRAKGVHIVSVEFSRSAGKLAAQIKSAMQVRRLLKREFSLIHCHSPICAAIVRIWAEMYRRRCGTKVIYTAHGFHFYSGAPMKNWIFFYPVERWLSRYTDVLITINHEDYLRAKRSFKAKKTIFVPGIGIDLEKFRGTGEDCSGIRESLGLSEKEIMLLSVGELSPRKNHKIVIQSLGKLNNPRIHYFIAGMGRLKGSYEHLVKKQKLEKNVHFLGYRTDISRLCQAADLYVFPSLQEGLPVALMEAIACGTPVICSKIRGNIDLIRDGDCLFDPKSADSLARCMKGKIAANGNEKITSAMKDLTDFNYRRLHNYDLQTVKRKMYQVYKEIAKL